MRSSPARAAASAARSPRRWRALGAKVVVSSRKADACEEVAAGITQKRRRSRRHRLQHLAQDTRSRRWSTGTLKHYGRIDILVCNAAVNPYYGPLGGITDEAFDKIMGSNVKSNLWLCNLAIPDMAERGGGAVIIISSIGGIRGTECSAPTASPRRPTSRSRATSRSNGARRTCA